MLGGVVYSLPVTHAQQPREGSAQAGPRHGEARETRVLKACWDPGTRAEEPEAFQNSPGPGEQAWTVEGPGTRVEKICSGSRLLILWLPTLDPGLLPGWGT